MSQASDLGLKLMVEYGATGLPREAYERLSALQQRVEELEAALRIIATEHGHCGKCGKLGDTPGFVSCGSRDCFWEPPDAEAIARAALTPPQQQ